MAGVGSFTDSPGQRSGGQPRPREKVPLHKPAKRPQQVGSWTGAPEAMEPPPAPATSLSEEGDELAKLVRLLVVFLLTQPARPLSVVPLLVLAMLVFLVVFAALWLRSRARLSPAASLRSISEVSLAPSH